MQKPSIPSGTRDFGPAEMAKRLYLLDTIRRTFRLYGYQPLETPAMENLSVLLGKYGEEGDKLLFRLLNSGDFLSKTTTSDFEAGSPHLVTKIAEKGLRYDLTVPFARYVVMNRGELTFPFKRYQIQPVWRADRPQKGRYREFYQCDADIVGTHSLLCEAEIIAMIQTVFHELGIVHYTIKINNRKILAGIAEAIGAPGREGDLCVAIDKLDKIGLDNVNKELIERGFGAGAVEALQPLLHLSGQNSEKITALRSLLQASDKGLQGLSELEEVFVYADQLGLRADLVAFDITLARGLSYYTGAIFEVKVHGVSIGSVSGGGRYDDLTGVFGLKDMPGVGFSFGVDRLYDVMNELNLFPENSLEGVRLLIAHFDPAAQAHSLNLLRQARQAGIATEMYPHVTKLKKQLDYADARRVVYVAMAGSNELAEQKFTLRDMRSGRQELLTAEELLAVVRG